MSRVLQFISSGIMIIAALVFLNSMPALADEFNVVILLEPTASETTKQEFMRGFQLAVDQSPDVSHPPGREGGDHLGSIDVEIEEIQNANTNAELIARTVSIVGSADIIVADLAAEGLNSVFGLITESGTVLFSMQSNEGLEATDSIYFFGITPLHDVAALLVNGSLSFDTAYQNTYGNAPTAAAKRGYMAGRMIDISVQATDRDPTDATTISRELSSIIPVTSENLDVSPTQDLNSQPPPEDTYILPPSDFNNARLLSVGILVVIITSIVMLVRVLIKRKRK